MSEDQEQRARLVCLRLLNYRARSCGELTARLEQKGFPPEVIRRTLAELSRQGLVDDEEFARQWAEERVRLHPMGGAALREKLRQRGISAKLAAAAVEQALGEGRELDSALGLARRRLRPSPDAAGAEKERARLGRLLAGRGFCYSIIRKVLEVCARETTEEF
jgi:regulatory protein